MSDQYKVKYLKYKQKYLQLKKNSSESKQVGGTNFLKKIFNNSSDPVPVPVPQNNVTPNTVNNPIHDNIIKLTIVQMFNLRGNPPLNPDPVNPVYSLDEFLDSKDTFKIYELDIKSEINNRSLRTILSKIEFNNVLKDPDDEFYFKKASINCSGLTRNGIVDIFNLSLINLSLYGFPEPFDDRLLDGISKTSLSSIKKLKLRSCRVGYIDEYLSSLEEINLKYCILEDKNVLDKIVAIKSLKAINLSWSKILTPIDNNTFDELREKYPNKEIY